MNAVEYCVECSAMFVSERCLRNKHLLPISAITAIMCGRQSVDELHEQK